MHEVYFYDFIVHTHCKISNIKLYKRKDPLCHHQNTLIVNTSEIMFQSYIFHGNTYTQVYKILILSFHLT